MPDTRRGLIELFTKITPSDHSLDPPTAYIEQIHGYNPNNARGNMFEFGRNVERPEAILETLGVRIILVPPQRWQKALHLGEREAAPRKATKAQIDKRQRDWKNKLKAEAERRFPNVKVTLATCDALLLLDYAKQQEGIAEPGYDPEKELMG